MNKKPEVATKKPEAKKSTPKKPESAEVTAKREAAKPEAAAQKLAAAKPDVAAKKLAAAKADVTTKKSAALRADVATKREAAKPEVAKKLAAAKPGVAARREAVNNVRETSHKSSGQIVFLLANPFPQATREFAEKTVVQTGEAFDRSNVALEAAVDTLERSFDAAAQGAFALNRKIIEIARQNLDSSFDLAKSLVGAKNLAEIVELQAAYWGKLFGALRALRRSAHWRATWPPIRSGRLRRRQVSGRMPAWSPTRPIVTREVETMDTNSKPEAAAQRARQQYSEGQEALLQTAFPQAAREFAEKTVAQTREAYERSNKVLETTLETIEKSFDAAGQGAVALNRKIMEIAQRNLNSGFELAKQLAGAKNLAEIVELQSAYWQKQVEALTSQAEEVRSLATKVAADAAQPTKEHVKRSMDDVSKKS